MLETKIEKLTEAVTANTLMLKELMETGEVVERTLVEVADETIDDLNIELGTANTLMLKELMETPAKPKRKKRRTKAEIKADADADQALLDEADADAGSIPPPPAPELNQVETQPASTVLTPEDIEAGRYVMVKGIPVPLGVAESMRETYADHQINSGVVPEESELTIDDYRLGITRLSDAKGVQAVMAVSASYGQRMVDVAQSDYEEALQKMQNLPDIGMPTAPHNVAA